MQRTLARKGACKRGLRSRDLRANADQDAEADGMQAECMLRRHGLPTMHAEASVCPMHAETSVCPMHAEMSVCPMHAEASVCPRAFQLLLAILYTSY
jgi:hypothetical protein